MRSPSLAGILAAVLLSFSLSLAQQVYAAKHSSDERDAVLKDSKERIRERKSVAEAARSLLRESPASPQLDHIDKVLLDFLVDEFDVDAVTSSDYFTMHQNINNSRMKEARFYNSIGRSGGGQGSMADGLMVQAEMMKVDNKAGAARERKLDYIRLRVWYQLGWWEDAVTIKPLTEACNLILGRAWLKAAESGAPMTPDNLMEGTGAWAAAFTGIDVTPANLSQRAVLYADATKWYEFARAKIPVDKQQNLAGIWLQGVIAYLTQSEEKMTDREIMAVAADCVKLARKAGMMSLPERAVKSLEHKQDPKVDVEYTTEEAFALLALWYEEVGEKRKAAEVWRAYLDEYAGFNTMYRAQAKLKDVAKAKLGFLGDPGVRQNRQWGVRFDHRQKAEDGAVKDKKRKEMGLDF